MKTLLTVLVSLAVGVAMSYGIWLTAGGMTGAGHGWYGAVPSVWSIFFLPLTGFGFLARRATWTRYVAVYVTLGCLLLDAAVGTSIASEGWPNLVNAQSKVPEAFYTWAGLWFSWHAAIVAVWMRFASRSGASPNGGAPGPLSSSGAVGAPPSVS